MIQRTCFPKNSVNSIAIRILLILALLIQPSLSSSNSTRRTRSSNCTNEYQSNQTFVLDYDVGVVLQTYIDVDADTIQMELSYPNIDTNWLSYAFSERYNMTPNIAVIGQIPNHQHHDEEEDDDDTQHVIHAYPNVMTHKYALMDHTPQGILPMEELSSQDSIVRQTGTMRQNGTHTILSVTQSLSEPNEAPVQWNRPTTGSSSSPLVEQIIIWAIGGSSASDDGDSSSDSSTVPNPMYHLYRGYNTIVLYGYDCDDDEEDSDTKESDPNETDEKETSDDDDDDTKEMDSNDNSSTTNDVRTDTSRPNTDTTIHIVDEGGQVNHLINITDVLETTTDVIEQEEEDATPTSSDNNDKEKEVDSTSSSDNGNNDNDNTKPSKNTNIASQKQEVTSSEEEEYTTAVITFPPTLPRGECFNSTLELQYTVQEYFRLTSERERIESAMAFQYGYPIGAWCVDLLTDLSYLFANLVINLTTGDDIDSTYTTTNRFNLSLWNTTNVQTMKGMFYNTQFIVDDDTTVMDNNSTDTNSTDTNSTDTNSTDTDNTTSTTRSTTSSSMTYSVGMEQWDTSNVMDMSEMFYNTTTMTRSTAGVNNVFMGGTVGDWNISQVLNMSHMFYNTISFQENLCSTWGYQILYNRTNDTIPIAMTNMFLYTSCPVDDMDPMKITVTNSTTGIPTTFINPMCHFCLSNDAVTSDDDMLEVQSDEEDVAPTVSPTELPTKSKREDQPATKSKASKASKGGKKSKKKSKKDKSKKKSKGGGKSNKYNDDDDDSTDDDNYDARTAPKHVIATISPATNNNHNTNKNHKNHYDNTKNHGENNTTTTTRTADKKVQHPGGGDAVKIDLVDADHTDMIFYDVDKDEQQVVDIITTTTKHANKKKNDSVDGDAVTNSTKPHHNKGKQQQQQHGND